METIKKQRIFSTLEIIEKSTKFQKIEELMQQVLLYKIDVFKAAYNDCILDIKLNFFIIFSTFLISN